MIFVTPYRLDKNLGKAYNDIMRMSDETVCFIDGDTMFLTPDFGHLIDDYHRRFPETVLTCRTNRIHPLSKQLDGKMDEECDVRKLLCKAEERKRLRTVTEIKPGEAMSGLLMVVPKKVWHHVPFKETGGCLGVDSQFRKDLHSNGIKIYIMDGIFIFHQYRLIQGAGFKQHLI
jgi:hypothetical protein